MGIRSLLSGSLKPDLYYCYYNIDHWIVRRRVGAGVGGGGGGVRVLSGILHRALKSLPRYHSTFRSALPTDSGLHIKNPYPFQDLILNFYIRVSVLDYIFFLRQSIKALDTNPRPGQYLRHAHNHITPAVAAMESCFGLVGLTSMVSRRAQRRRKTPL